MQGHGGGMTARHWMTVLGAGLLMSLNVLFFVSAGLLLPQLAVSLGIGLGQAMVFISIFMVAGAGTLALAGPLLFRLLGPRRLALLGGLVNGLALFGVAYVDSLVPLYVLGFIAGLLPTAAFQMTGAALVNDWFIERRGLMQGMLMGIASLGGIVAGTAVPAVLETAGWRGGFQLVGAVTTGVAVLAALALIRNRPADVGLHPYGAHHVVDEVQAEATGVPPATALKSPAFVVLIVALTCYSAMMAVQQHFAAMMSDRGLDVAAVGTLFSVLSVANIVTTLLLGAISDRWGAIAAYVVAGALLLVSLALFLLTAGYPWQLTAVLVFSIPAITSPIMTPILLHAAFGARSFVQLLGLFTATMPIGIAIGSPLWGLAKDTTGSYDVALVVALVLTVLCVGLVAYAVVAGRRLWSTAATTTPDLVAE